MRIDLSGKRVAVTGAAQGIGRAIVAAMAEAGASVAALDLDETGLEAARAAGATALVPLDLSRREGVLEAFAGLADSFGPVDMLVTAAGGVRGQTAHPLETIEEARWHEIFGANVDAAFWCAQAVAPGMKAKGEGRIVTIASGAGLRPSLTGIQAYSAAKHALVGLTKQLALELGPHGITVNSVAPGFVLSNPATQRQWESYGADGQKRLVEAIHMRRLGTPEDIANAVLFLCSSQAGWISGQILSVDGGRA
ncbi:3-oxoacyl-[acyl-carrier protein] reductase [Devosia enhydra]|uniref:3-oxoacyl-[acyl-carrier protein] reductase n=1 Tax=Devosia enhydra TaxID=665118 RepID=A0A1K2HZT7_9HYPH|nr:SDR family NAD(P)-dependent oxidoreductase [Devosia enhydra]SFZ85451.1 3-oxoacyl-[acyl-carrier protein] reductase [Devosia enhydra]